MSRIEKIVALALFSFAAGSVTAQTTPQEDQTAPRAASSPHQRDTTSAQAQEAQPTTETEPSSASSPHQRQTTKEASATKDQMMKDCVKKQQSANSSMTMDQAKKACQDQMKSQESRSQY